MEMNEAIACIEQERWAVVVRHPRREWGNGSVSEESWHLLTYRGTRVRSSCPRLYDSRKKAESVALRSGGVIIKVQLSGLMATYAGSKPVKQAKFIPFEEHDS